MTWQEKLAGECQPQEYKNLMDAINEKPERRKAYKERHGKATYGLEVYADDKARMQRWLKQEKLTQAEGLKKLLDNIEA